MRSDTGGENNGWWAVVLAAFVAGALLSQCEVRPLRAHEAGKYPFHCCNDADCAPVTGTRSVWRGGKVVERWAQTSHGEAQLLPPGNGANETGFFPSPDGKAHACFRKWDKDPTKWTVRCWLGEEGL